MKYIISGLFKAFILHFKDLNTNLQKIFADSQYDINILKDPLAQVDASIFTRYMEEVVRLKKNHRIGLESGFRIPFMLTGTYYNMYYDCKTVHDLFENLKSLDSTANNLTGYETRVDKNYLYYETPVDFGLAEKYPVAIRQWIEMQYGIGLQYAYSFTGRFLHPVLAFSPYPKEGDFDLLEEYLDCPVKFNQEKAGMVFKKSVLDLRVITTRKELFPVFEYIMNEIEYRQNKNNLSSTLRRYLNHNLSVVNKPGLKQIAERFYMSERNLQRKLKEEGTSYQQILDNLRIQLAEKYLQQHIPFVEIAFLLGFENQSAFNKFFKKHFHTTPGEYL